MTLRVFCLAFVCVAAASGCGSPASPTPTGPQSPAPPAPSPAGQSTSPGAAATPGALRIERAVVVEFQYPGYPGWYYAPQVRVTEASGAGSVTFSGADITVPGLNTWACSGGPGVPAGQTRELFPEVYGDYPLTFDKPGQRLSGDFLIVIRFADQLGQIGTLAVTAPVTPGGLPNSYTGGTSTWSCR